MPTPRYVCTTRATLRKTVEVLRVEGLLSFSKKRVNAKMYLRYGCYIKKGRRGIEYRVPFTISEMLLSANVYLRYACYTSEILRGIACQESINMMQVCVNDQVYSSYAHCIEDFYRYKTV